jgi:intracellular septation protein
MLIISSLVVYGAIFIKQRKLEKSQWLTLVACLVFGSLTLAFHSETFLKWKAPVVNWLFALAFAGSHFIGDKPPDQAHDGPRPEPAGCHLDPPERGLDRVFPVLRRGQPVRGVHLPGAIWVDFKVFGSLGMTVLFLIAQGIYLSRHLHDTDPTDTSPKTED